MFVYTKKHPASKNKSVFICHSVREGTVVQRKILCRIGTASDSTELAALTAQAERELERLKAPKKADNPISQAALLSQTREISRKNSGVTDLLGQLYDDLGFSNILSGKAAKILKSLVLGRFIEPSSKHKASFILERRFGESISADAVYRMMDVLEKNLDKSREVVFNATRQVNNGKIDLVLFDVTTLHFETVEQDELRDFGFSKNCRFNTTQVVLALAIRKMVYQLDIDYFLAIQQKFRH